MNENNNKFKYSSLRGFTYKLRILNEDKMQIITNNLCKVDYLNNYYNYA